MPAETLEIGHPPLPACAVVHQRDTRSLCHTPALHAPASRARLPHRARAHTPAITRQRATHACHTAHAHAYPRPSRASKPRTPATPHTHTATPPPARASEPRMPAASNAAKASFVAQGGTQGLRPPRLLRSGCRRRQHVPPCTNATHAHACHTAHAHACRF